MGKFYSNNVTSKSKLNASCLDLQILALRINLPNKQGCCKYKLMIQ